MGERERTDGSHGVASVPPANTESCSNDARLPHSTPPPPPTLFPSLSLCFPFSPSSSSRLPPALSLFLSCCHPFFQFLLLYPFLFPSSLNNEYCTCKHLSLSSSFPPPSLTLSFQFPSLSLLHLFHCSSSCDQGPDFSSSLILLLFPSIMRHSPPLSFSPFLLSFSLSPLYPFLSSSCSLSPMSVGIVGLFCSWFHCFSFVLQKDSCSTRSLALSLSFPPSLSLVSSSSSLHPL